MNAPCGIQSDSRWFEVSIERNENRSFKYFRYYCQDRYCSIIFHVRNVSFFVHSANKRQFPRFWKSCCLFNFAEELTKWFSNCRSTIFVDCRRYAVRTVRFLDFYFLTNLKILDSGTSNSLIASTSAVRGKIVRVLEVMKMEANCLEDDSA